MNRVLRALAIVVGATFLMSAWATAEEKGPRLKFRGKGSVCSCESGLDEETIVRGQQPDPKDATEGRDSPKKEQQKPETSAPQNSEQPKTTQKEGR